MDIKKCNCGKMLAPHGPKKLFFICDGCGSVFIRYSNLDKKYIHVGRVNKKYIEDSVNDLFNSSKNGTLRVCKCKNMMIRVYNTGLEYPKSRGRRNLTFTKYVEEFKSFHYWICMSCGEVYEYKSGLVAESKWLHNERGART